MGTVPRYYREWTSSRVDLLELLDFVSILILPLAYQAIPNPALVRWQLRHGFASAPPDLARSAERWERLIPLLSTLLLLVGMIILVRSGGEGATRLKINCVRLSDALRDGFAAGIGWTAVQVGLMYLVRASIGLVSQNPLSRWPATLWVPFSLIVAASEEVWRAYCLIRWMPYGVATAVSVTTLSFALAHFPPTGRAIFAAAFGLFAARLFIGSDSIWVPVFAHATVNVGALGINRWWRWSAKRSSKIHGTHPGEPGRG